MSRVVMVLPSIVPEMTQACLATLHPDIIDPTLIPQPPSSPQRDTEIRIVNGAQWADNKPDVRLVVVWNTPEHNLGVAASWDVGVDECLRAEADWLVILSASVRFGPEGGRDLLKALAPPYGQDLVLEASDGMGWHLIAFSREVLMKVGRFDPVFFPAYFEDNDWSVRFQRAYDRDTHAPGFVGPLWPKVPVDATLLEVAHGIRRGGVSADFEALKELFEGKWGRREEYQTPYDDPALDWTFVGPHA